MICFCPKSVNSWNFVIASWQKSHPILIKRSSKQFNYHRFYTSSFHSCKMKFFRGPLWRTQCFSWSISCWKLCRIVPIRFYFKSCFTSPGGSGEHCCQQLTTWYTWPVWGGETVRLNLIGKPMLKENGRQFLDHYKRDFAHNFRKWRSCSLKLKRDGSMLMNQVRWLMLLKRFSQSKSRFW